MKTPLTIILALSISQATANIPTVATPRTLNSERVTLDITPDMAYTMIELWQKIQADIEEARTKISEKKKEAISLKNVITNISKTDPTYKKHWDETRKKFKPRQSPRTAKTNKPPMPSPELIDQASKVPPAQLDPIINQDLTQLPDLKLIFLRRDISALLTQEDRALKDAQKRRENVEDRLQNHLRYMDFYEKINNEIEQRTLLLKTKSKKDSTPITSFE